MPSASGVERRTQRARLPRYQQIARRYAAEIDQGTLAAGERFPSVRRLAADERVSVSTVLQAITQLELLGLVEARPRSGHFVRQRTRPAAPQPAPSSVRPSPVGVSALVTRVYQAARDPGLVVLSSAAPHPDLLPARALARCMAVAARRPVERGVRYEMPPGSLELRRLVAARAPAWGGDLTADDLVVTTGAVEGIHLCLLAVARPGDVVAIESPAYYGTLKTLEHLRLRALEIPCRPDTGMDLDELERRIDRHKVAAVVAVPTFSNPLGSCMPDAAKERMVELLASRGIPLIEDDVYGDLTFGPVRPRAAKAFDRRGLVMFCASITKTIAPGYRIGWVAPGAYLKQIELLKFALNVATPTLPQLAVARYLQGGGYDRHLRVLRDRIGAIVARTAAAVAASFPEGTRVASPRGGCFLWVELPASVDAMELHARALDAGVSIAPGPIFSPAGGHRSCIRLACAEPWSERIDGAIRLVGRLARRLAAAPAR
jgi:DNA-binding transcriptional MocR family regulator